MPPDAILSDEWPPLHMDSEFPDNEDYGPGELFCAACGEWTEPDLVTGRCPTCGGDLDEDDYRDSE